VLEAFHFLRAKAASLEFFETGRDAPERFGPGAAKTMEADHGPAWREVVGHGARAWLRIIQAGQAEGGDLYQGRLGEITAPTLFLHGARDPRSEPGELEAARRALPSARVVLLDTGHSPHTGGAAAEATRAAVGFLEEAFLQRGR